MTYKRVKQINRTPQYQAHGFSGEYGFVFSSEIQDWMGSKGERVKDRTRRKEEKK